MQLHLLCLGLSGELIECHLPLPGDLYDTHDTKEARRRVRELLCGLPGWYTLESGRQTGLHTHPVIPVELEPLLPASVWRQHFDPERGGLFGKLKYLSKPRLWQACRKNHERTVPKRRQLIADELLLKARKYRLEAGHSRLPVSSGLVNVPSRLDVPPVLLLLVLFVLDLDAERRRAAEWLDLTRRAAVLTHRKARNSRTPVRPGTHRAAPPRPAHGLPVRRVEQIGHARPPPIGKRVQVSKSS